jgi:DNA polymerase-3 subunit epsilon
VNFSKIRKCGFDTETTSADPETAHIVTAALVFTGGNPATQTFNWLINSGVPSEPGALEAHGISNERAAAEGVDPKVALEDLAAKLAKALTWGMPVVAFNLAFDWTVLDRDLARNGLASMADRLTVPPTTLLDPHVIDKTVDKYRKGPRKLKPTCEHYGIALENWHTADADAMAAVLLMDEIAERNPQLAAMSPRELFMAQRGWASDIAAGLQLYFRSPKAGEKQDPNAVIDGSWPLRGES